MSSGSDCPISSALFPALSLDSITKLNCSNDRFQRGSKTD